MKYHIDKKSKISSYMQLYVQLRNDIINGLYKYGTKLPSKRLLAEESGTSVITVEHTYDILQNEGYIESRQRSGYFVIYKEKDFYAVAENTTISSEFAKDNHINHNESAKDTANASAESYNISFHAGSTFPFSVLSKTMRKVLTEYKEQILVKSPNNGLLELRTSISEYLARNVGIEAHPKQIIIGSGSEYLYGLILQLLGTDKIYAIENPCYEKIKQVYSIYNAKFEMLKMGKDGIMSNELHNSKAEILHITPFNSYPSNVTASVSKRNEYVEWAKKRNGFIIEDNYGAELTPSSKREDTIFSMSNEGHIIYLNTFSKTIAPSIRIGYMVLPENLTADFESKLGFYSCTVPDFEQYVLSELIKSGDFERHINRQRRYFRTKK